MLGEVLAVHVFGNADDDSAAVTYKQPLGVSAEPSPLATWNGFAELLNS